MIIIIRLGPIVKTCSDQSVRLSCKIAISPSAAEIWRSKSLECDRYHDASFIATDYIERIGEIDEIWFEAKGVEIEDILDDRADCFVVAMLFYSMLTGEDLVSDVPVSEKLLFHLNDYLIPALFYGITDGRNVKVVANPISKANTKPAHRVGTGMSCGIDSIETMYRYYDRMEKGNYRITHLTFFDVGADKGYVPRGRKWSEIEQELLPFEEAAQVKRDRAERVSQEAGLGFVFVKSNLTMLYQGLFEESHLYRTASAALFLQGFFSLYYLSSTGCAPNDYSLDLRLDPGHYEVSLAPALCTENMQFEVSGKALDRVQKFAEIQDYPIAKRYLNVCSDPSPCYNCTKDFRMIIIFDILGCEEKFETIYPIAKNKQNRWRAYYWLLKYRNSDEMARCIWKYVSEKKLPVPNKAKFKYILWRLLNVIRIKKN